MTTGVSRKAGSLLSPAAPRAVHLRHLEVEQHECQRRCGTIGELTAQYK